MRITKRRTTLLFAIAAAVLLTALAFRPKPVVVESVAARVSPMMVTVDDDGITRVIERYVITAPVAGRHSRIDVHAGDPIRAGDVLVRIDPAPLDARQSAELDARLRAATERLREAKATEQRARIALDQATRDRSRGENLAKSGIASAQNLEQWRTAESDRRREFDATVFRSRAASFDVETIRVALAATSDGQPLVLRAPVNGRILRVIDESEAVVPAGKPLIEVGDPSQIEVAVDVLSTDAVKVRTGHEMLLHGWGSDSTLRATVVRIEPAAFTKLSALGIEEQRVNVIARLRDAPQQLGDQFRVDASIVLWSGEVLNLPNTALFHTSNGWSVYAVRNGRARLQAVTIGHRGSDQTEIRGGIRAGDAVIAYPSDQIRDGVRVVQASGTTRE